MHTLKSLGDLSFDSAIASFKQQAAQFGAAYNQFLNNEQYAAMDSSLYSDWQYANKFASAVKSTIEYINGQVDAASNWLAGVFGLNGLHSMKGMNGLGFIPLIPIAYIVAASAALTYAYSLINNSNNAVEQYKIKAGLAQQGIDPTSLNSQSVSGVVGDSLKWVIIATAAYFIVPKLINQYKRGR